MNLKIKKHSLPILIVIFLFLSVLGILFVKGGDYYKIEGKYMQIGYEDCFSGSVGYTVENSSYVVDGDDPNLLLDLSKNEVYGLRLNFSSPVKANNIQFYFGRENASFSEMDSMVFSGQEVSSVEMIGMSPFKFLRIDINQNFDIESIEVVYEIDKISTVQPIEYLFFILISAIITISLSLIIDMEKVSEKIKKNIGNVKIYILDNKKAFVIRACQFILCLVVPCLLELLCGKLTGAVLINKYRIIFFIAIGIIIYIVVFFRKNIYKYAHIYFFVVTMLIGSVQVIAAPSVVGVSWDDEIHYGCTTYLSWGTEGVSLADQKLIEHYKNVIFDREEYSYQGRVEWNVAINEYAKSYNTLTDGSSYRVDRQHVAYIPAAIALRIGRGLNLDFSTNFMFGKWINLLTYTTIISYAIKLLKRGKLIAVAIGLIPTNIFLAASYAYDWWLTAFVILGYALFMSDVQREKPISTKKFAITMLVMVIGILPKAVYFPLVFPLMLFKKERYENAKLCRSLVIVAILVLMASFVLPMLSNGVGTGDMRGGSGINSGEQIKFILTSPLQYTKILLSFLYSYLSLDVSLYYLTFFAYMGQAPFYTVCIMTIAICCAVDNMTETQLGKEDVLVKGGIILAAFGALVLCATALYISFTPVAHPTILGCQWRYIIPVLFPVLFFMSKMQMNVSEIVKRNVLVLTSLAMIFVYFNGIYTFCIANY